MQDLIEISRLAAGVVQASSEDIVLGEADSERARIIVEDRGPGVPTEDRERICERFYPGRYTGGSAGGVGLGLVLEGRYDGGGGSRFVVELPVLR